MSRIADAQRRAGRLIAVEAELAWAEARQVAGGASRPAMPPLPWSIDERPKRARFSHEDATPVVPLDQTAFTARERRVVGRDDELAALVRRLFGASPVGEAARAIVFCSGTRQRPGLVTRIAKRLVVDQPGSRVAVVQVSAGVRPSTVPSDAGVEVFSTNPVDAQYRGLELRSRFDFLLFDAQLVGEDPDVLALARSADAVVVLVAENATRREAAKAMVDALQRTSAKLLGAVLTDRTYPIPRRIYERL
jgi:hypothetical protein